MKKRIIMMFLIISVIFVGCSSKNENEKMQYPNIYNYLNSITLETFNEFIKSEKDFYIYIGRPSCHDCELFDERLINDITDKNELKKIYYLNVSKIYENKKEWVEFKTDLSIEGTPKLFTF